MAWFNCRLTEADLWHCCLVVLLLLCPIVTYAFLVFAVNYFVPCDAGNVSKSFASLLIEFRSFLLWCWTSLSGNFIYVGVVQRCSSALAENVKFLQKKSCKTQVPVLNDVSVILVFFKGTIRHLHVSEINISNSFCIRMRYYNGMTILGGVFNHTMSYSIGCTESAQCHDKLACDGYS